MKLLLRLAAPLTLGAAFLAADEGMWLLDHFPAKRVQEKYGFRVTDEFLTKVRQGSVRFNNGGSGSFVSGQGLLFTNHHVGADCIQKLSTKENDYMKNGFSAATMAEERACPDLEVNIVLRMEDVTGKVTGAVSAGTAAAEAGRLRRAAIAAMEKECTDKSGNRCNVVTLFSGGQYHLYQYKKYTDVRLVFAPEFAIAAFGGDPDNFTYPRYCLDFALFRAYENGKPVTPTHYFPWSREGAKEGELGFVPGNPGTTGRLATVAQLQFSRDHSYPLIMRVLESGIQTLQRYSQESAENKRIATENLQSFQNSFKAYTGFMRGLRDPQLMARKQKDERALREALAKKAQQQEEFGRAWDDLATAYNELESFYKPYYLFEPYAGRGSQLMSLAREIVRYAEETKKPNAERLREYTEAGLASLEQEMFSTAPIYDSMEQALLADYFRLLVKELGTSEATVKAVLDGRTPEQAAAFYVKNTTLQNVDVRKKLAKDVEAMRSSDDAMIRLARLLDGVARASRKRYEDRVEAVLTSSAAKIARARFAMYGDSEYPDATFTLRLAYGPIKGYTNAAGQKVPWATNFQGLYQRATGEEPFALPPSWIKAKSKLKLQTPFNFVSTADTHGGNSGSPTLNQRGEVIGILFDGNLEGLPNRFLYEDETARSVHVASQGIVEALRSVYGADRILKELTGGRP